MISPIAVWYLTRRKRDDDDDDEDFDFDSVLDLTGKDWIIILTGAAVVFLLIFVLPMWWVTR